MGDRTRLNIRPKAAKKEDFFKARLLPLKYLYNKRLFGIKILNLFFLISLTTF
jgi:hypothetical protein